MMKKLILILFAIYLIIPNVSGQWYNRYYPDRSLSDLNHSELLVLNKKATDLRNTGKGIYIGGIVVSAISFTVIVIAGTIDLFAFIGTGEGTVPVSVYNTSLAFTFVGLGIAVVGIPFWLTGWSRMKEISSMPNLKISNTPVAILPSLQYNRVQNKFVPGLSLSFRF
jgi:hypothetical protein